MAEYKLQENVYGEDMVVFLQYFLMFLINIKRDPFYLFIHLIIFLITLSLITKICFLVHKTLQCFQH